MRGRSSRRCMADLRATVVICTRNRARTLARALEALCVLRVPALTAWEVLVVDNASTDSTPDVVARYHDRLPMRSVIAPQLGLSNARNLAVAEAHGEYLLWIDDDAVPHGEWLAAYLTAFEAWPVAAVFGGPIDVAFDAPVPDWFARVLPRVAPLYAQRELGDVDAPLVAHEETLPFGTNYATRKLDQRRYAYDPALGRHPDHPHRGSEETKVMLAMLNSGLAGRWVSQARVTHLLDADRASTEFIARHSCSYGVYRAQHFPYPGIRVGGVPVRTWWRAAYSASRYAWTSRRAPPEMWIEDLIQRSEAIGNVLGLLALRREHRARAS